jgi:hypothetical protein
MANGKYRTAPIFYAVRDVRAIIRRLERGEVLPPDSVETARVRASEIRHGRTYARQTKADTIWDFDSIDFAKFL